ncbi:MAG: C25 family cysteine peptidase, partial [Bacteroidota bacterium]
MLKSTLTGFFVFILCSAAAFSQREGSEPLRVEQLDAAHWRVTVANAEPRLLTMPGEPPFGQVLMPGYDTRIVPGLPALPVRVLEFLLPGEGSISVTVSGLREEAFPADLAAFGGSGIEEKPTIYTEILPVTVRDEDRVGALRFQPARYDAAQGRLHWLRSAVLDIRFTASNARSAPQPTALLSPAIQRTQAGEEMLRISTLSEGMYRLGYDDVAGAGVNPAGIDPALFRLTLRGEEIPLEISGAADGSFDAGDAMLFYAPRKHGTDGEYLDEWTNENVLLLSWSGAPGLRWNARDAAPASHPAAVPVTEFPMSVHLEEDHEYHRGDFEYTDMLVTKRVVGETWMWGYLLKRDGAQKQDSIRKSFALPNPAATNGLLRVRAKGASRDSSLLRATLNGVVIGEQLIGNYQAVTPEWSIPAGLLRPVDNELVLTNVGRVPCPPENPACSIERFYVDWAELQFSTNLAGATAPLLIDASARYGGQLPPALFRISVPDIGGTLQGYDLASGNRLTNIDHAGGAAVMALDSSGRYFLFAETDIQSPQAVQRIRIPDYVGGATQADYLVVTHGNFLAQAQRLADYRRQSDGYSTVVADVDDLCDAYNFGQKSPDAIRAFVEDAWKNWPQPRPRFLCIIGDASWDARQVKEGSSKVDFVPAYGNPVSDNYYVSFNAESFDATPMLAVGRIPAETPAQADAVIDKIIAYESAPSQPWDDRFLFSVGGENPFEQDVQLRPVVDLMIQNWVEPHCLEPRLIIKKTLDFVSYDDLDTLIHEVNQGISWFFFVGHGGTRVIDVGVERPDIFDNEDKYIFFVTMSCNTAHFAEPFETGLNERFVMSPRNGAITSLGTSGLGIINYDYVLSRGIFRAMLDSGARTYGDIVTLGKRELVRSFGIGDQTTINTVNQVELLGDPATRIPLALTAELAIRDGDIRTEPEILVEQTDAIIKTRLSNDGLCVEDSVDVLLAISSNGSVVHRELRRFPAFAVDTLVEWNYDFAGVDGTAEIRTTIDPGDLIVEKDESNNSAAITVNVLPRGITQIFPLDRAVVGKESATIEFLLANPTFVPDIVLNPEAEIEYALDTEFSRGTQRMQSPLGMVFTRLTATAPSVDAVWYWRARMRTSGGPEHWSATRSFTLQPQSAGEERWVQTDAAQFSMTQTEALEVTPAGGVQLGQHVLELEAVSGGFNG